MADSIIVRPSEIKEFKRCRRQWELDYIHGLKSYDSEEGAAGTGTLVHKALEVYYRGMDPLTEMVWPDTPDGVLSRIMVEGYLEWLEETGVDDGYQIEGVEMELEVPINDPYGHWTAILRGHLDLLASDPWGSRLLIDHKTVQGLEQYSRQLQVDPQMLTYAWMLRELGQPVRGAIHNAMRRVKRTATAKPPFYQRNIVRYNDAQLDNHGGNLVYILQEMVDLRGDVAYRDRSGTYPNPTRDCTWDCPHMAICPSFDDGSDIDRLIEITKKARQ